MSIEVPSYADRADGVIVESVPAELIIFSCSSQTLLIKHNLYLGVLEDVCNKIVLLIVSRRCFAFAELPWYQRKVAAVIFASPPTATYEEALEFFLKAEEVDPNFYSKNLLMLGKTYMMLRDDEHAATWLRKACDYPALTDEDKQVRKEALDLLKKLKG